MTHDTSGTEKGRLHQATDVFRIVKFGLQSALVWMFFFKVLRGMATRKICQKIIVPKKEKNKNKSLSNFSEKNKNGQFLSNFYGIFNVQKLIKKWLLYVNRISKCQ